MPGISYPGVFITETHGARPVRPARTETAVFVGHLVPGPGGAFPGIAPGDETAARLVTGVGDFEILFGPGQTTPVAYAVRQFFLNGGRRAYVVATAVPGSAEALIGNEATRTGLGALAFLRPDLFNMLCIPEAADLADGDAYGQVYAAAHAVCVQNDALLLIDLPAREFGTGGRPVEAWNQGSEMASLLEGAGLMGLSNAAVHYPRLVVPEIGGTGGASVSIGTSGTMAGVIARTDMERGVWKAPAGLAATLRNAQPSRDIDNALNEDFNMWGFNCLRRFALSGPVSWGARTLSSDPAAQYLPAKRMALFIRQSLAQSLTWTVFEPNGEALWAEIRLTVDAFLHQLYRQGAFQATTPDEAYSVKCDADTTTPEDVLNGRVNIHVAFAPSRPAEFVIIRLSPLTSETA